MTRHGRRVAIVALAGILSAIVGYRWWYGRTHESTNDAQVAGHVIPVIPRVTGYVTRVYVADDALVREGDTLLTLDARDLVARRDQAAAAWQAAGARANVGRAGAESRAASSQVVALRAALAAAELQLSYATLVAPVAGRVANRSVEPGQLVAAGRPLMAVVRRDSMWVVANVQETQLRRLRVGLLSCISIDAFPEHVLRGHVASIQQATGSLFSLLPPDNATGTFTKVVQRVPVRIVLDRTSLERHELSPGLSASAVIDTRPSRARDACDDAGHAPHPPTGSP